MVPSLRRCGSWFSCTRFQLIDVSYTSRYLIFSCVDAYCICFGTVYFTTLNVNKHHMMHCMGLRLPMSQSLLRAAPFVFCDCCRFWFGVDLFNLWRSTCDIAMLHGVQDVPLMVRVVLFQS